MLCSITALWTWMHFLFICILLLIKYPASMSESAFCLCEFLVIDHDANLTPQLTARTVCFLDTITRITLVASLTIVLLLFSSLRLSQVRPTHMSSTTAFIGGWHGTMKIRRGSLGGADALVKPVDGSAESPTKTENKTATVDANSSGAVSRTEGNADGGVVSHCDWIVRECGVSVLQTSWHAYVWICGELSRFGSPWILIPIAYPCCHAVALPLRQ